MSNYIYSNYNLNEIFMREKIQQAHEKKIQKIKENSKEAKNTFVNERNQNNFQLKKIRKINFDFHQKEKQQEINRCNQKLLQKLLDISMRNPSKRSPEREQSQEQNQAEQNPNKNTVIDQDKVNNKNEKIIQNSESPDNQNQQAIQQQKSIIRQHKFYMKTKHKNEEIHQQNIRIAQRIIGQTPIVANNQKLYEDYKRQQEFKSRIARYETDGQQVKLKRIQYHFDVSRKIGEVVSKISLVRNSASPTLRQTQNKLNNTETNQPVNQRQNTQQSPQAKLQTAPNSERIHIIKSPIRSDKAVKRNSQNDVLEQQNSQQSSKSNINLPPAIAQIKFNNQKTIIRQKSPSLKNKEQNEKSIETQQQNQLNSQQQNQLLHSQLHTDQTLSQTQQQKKFLETTKSNKINETHSSPKRSAKKLSQSEQKLNQSASEINEDQYYCQEDFDEFSSQYNNSKFEQTTSQNKEVLEKQKSESKYYNSLSQNDEKEYYKEFDQESQSHFSLSKEQE
ncbi:hypothetical protein TTHERM_01220380 (macronuclear) [Tetrahymena thermophila SB210]|uniref:Uncharacterized protein n=1 Tax=Tetrahymena thermophila (strain SB210) TaxID=312017 RepID=Q24CL1_TETTS|nr:hypothetical protein TTHERM_01220380 [Tetrahymena thermophila SB210]EAS05518.2 hypothetical protein TTHERM_01220380 [Tetrahymena thermophila SB210]|eukprot:XP_001025763.2 hypothetical protein TTHERM_01220380 [Tetrahymena thermophila SB210]